MGRKSKEQLAYEAMPAALKTIYQLEKINKTLDHINEMNIRQSHKTNNWLAFIAEISMQNHKITNQNLISTKTYDKELDRTLKFLKEQ